MGRKDGTAPLQIWAEKNREGRNGCKASLSTSSKGSQKLTKPDASSVVTEETLDKLRQQLVPNVSITGLQARAINMVPQLFMIAIYDGNLRLILCVAASGILNPSRMYGAKLVWFIPL